MGKTPNLKRKNAQTFHIAFLFGTLGDRGPAKTISQLANSLAEQGYRVDILIREHTRNPNEFVTNRVSVIQLGTNSAKARRLRISNFTILPQLIEYLENEKPNILFSAGDPLNFTAYMAKVIGKAHSTSLIVSLRNSLEGVCGSSHRLRNGLIKLSIRITYPKANAVVAVSNGLAQEIASMIPEILDRIATIHTHIDVDSVRSQASESIEDDWVDNQDCPLIITAGRLTKQKDIGTLVRALPIVLEQRYVRLIILGEGEDKKALVRLAQDLGVDKNVRFLGSVTNPYKFMQRAHTFVLSSRWEGFSRVLVEAAACKCSLVSTDCPVGPREVLADGRWGRLVPVGSPDKLANAILESLNSPIDASARADDFTLSHSVMLHKRLFDKTANISWSGKR